MSWGLPIGLRSQPAVKLVGDLSESDFDSLIEALKGAHDFVEPRTQAAAVAEKTKVLSETDLARVIQAISSLEVGRNSWGLSLDRFSAEVAIGLKRNPEFSDINDAELARRIRTLLELPGVPLTGKALSLLADHPRVMLETTILTDLRPVFRDDVRKRPDVAALSHTLKIEYLQDGDQRLFYVAVDSKDLLDLQAACTKAQEEADSLTSLLRSADVKVIKNPPAD